VIFIFLLEVLNGDGPVPLFFASCYVCAPRKQRTCKPREGGAQPVGTMAINSLPPVTISDLDLPGPLSPGLMLGDGGPSLEEQAGDSASDLSW